MIKETALPTTGHREIYAVKYPNAYRNELRNIIDICGDGVCNNRSETCRNCSNDCNCATCDKVLYAIILPLFLIKLMEF